MRGYGTSRQGCGTSRSAADGAGSTARIFFPTVPRVPPQVTSWGCHLRCATVVELEGPRWGLCPRRKTGSHSATVLSPHPQAAAAPGGSHPARV